MKKIIKITGVALIIFALIMNLHSALFTYYGIENNHLEGAVWATAIASDGDSSGGSSSNGTSNSWYDSPVNSVVHCGTIYFVGNATNHAAGSVSYTTSGVGTVTATVSFGSSAGVNYTGSVAPHDATMRQCVGPNWAICTTITAIEACN